MFVWNLKEVNASGSDLKCVNLLLGFSILQNVTKNILESNWIIFLPLSLEREETLEYRCVCRPPCRKFIIVGNDHGRTQKCNFSLLLLTLFTAEKKSSYYTKKIAN